MSDLNTVEGLSREVVRLETICRRLTEENSVRLEALRLICTEAESWHSMHHAQNLIACDSICALIPRMQAAIALAKR
jgi:hypothetical protein